MSRAPFIEAPTCSAASETRWVAVASALELMLGGLGRLPEIAEFACECRSEPSSAWLEVCSAW